MQADGIYDASQAASSPLVTSRRPELLALTSVRCFAALEVVLLHTLFELGGDKARAIPAPLAALVTRGELAVSFFFVLSGFILAYTYCDGQNRLKTTAGEFWRARFARIYPLYFFAFLMDAPRVVRFFISSAASLPDALGKITAAGLAYLTLLQAWHPRVTNTWNTPGWTLSVEAFFYAGFPLLLWATRGFSPRRLAWAAIATWSVPIVAQMIVLHARIMDSTSAGALTLLRSFPPLRLPEFVLGVVAGRLFLARALERHRTELRWLSGVALVVTLALAIFSGSVPASVPAATLAAPLFACAILALARGALPTPRWLSSPALVLLGRASYAVYIVHQPFKQLFLVLAHWVRFDSPSPALLLGYLLSLQLLCIGLFLLFEDPMRRWMTRSRAYVAHFNHRS